MTKTVAYAITKYVGNEPYRMKGIGKIKDNDLILKDKKCFEDIVKRCHPIPGKPNEFKGFYDEFEEIETVTKFGDFETIEVNTEYKIWYKVLKEN